MYELLLLVTDVLVILLLVAGIALLNTLNRYMRHRMKGNK